MEASTDVETLLRYKAKAVLRQRARNLRGTIPTEAIAQRSAAIIERLSALPEIRDARSVAPSARWRRVGRTLKPSPAGAD